MEKLAKEIHRRVRNFTYTIVGSTLDLVFGVEKRKWLVGFGPVVVKSKSSVVVRAQPQTRFKGSKIVNTGDSGGLYIQGLFVGQRTQLPTFQSPIAVQAFAPAVMDNELNMDECEAAQHISFEVQNTSDEDKVFSATIMGHWTPSRIFN